RRPDHRAELRSDRALGAPPSPVAGRLSDWPEADDPRRPAQGLARAAELRGQLRTALLPYVAVRAVPAIRNVPQGRLGAALAADALGRLPAARAEARSSADADQADVAAAASQGRRRARAFDPRLPARRARAEEP